MMSEIQKSEKMVKSGSELLEALVRFGDEWSNHTPQGDDMTLVVLKVK